MNAPWLESTSSLRGHSKHCDYRYCLRWSEKLLGHFFHAVVIANFFWKKATIKPKGAVFSL